MNSLADMIWVEWRKSVRSKMPLWVGLGSLFMPFGIAFLLFVSKNPQISQKLGLVSAKANLVAYAATDWQAYMGLSGQMLAAGGFILYVLITSWIFGREFADGTLKDLLAVPVQRSSILLAKFIVMAIWSLVLSALILAVSLLMGAVIHLPGFATGILMQGSARLTLTALLTILVTTPFAFFASAGRGYLLPLGLAILLMIMTNFVAILGWGEYFPWAIPGLYSQVKSALTPASFVIVLLTAAVGIAATYYWWKYSDQNR